MSRPTEKHRFTLINLLVVMGLIFMVIALLLPAVQSGGRAAPWRAQCSVKLKQLGIALTNYHTQFGSFPPGLTYGSDVDPPTTENVSFGHVDFYSNVFTMLLPFMEEVAVTNTYVKDRSWHEQNAAFIMAPVNSLVCPASDTDDNPATDPFLQIIVNEVRASPLLEPSSLPALPGVTGFALSDYAACKGVSDSWCATPGWIGEWEEISDEANVNRRYIDASQERGMFDLSLPVEFELAGGSFACRESQITDGLSHTIAFGEASQGAKWKLTWKTCPWGDPDTYDDCVRDIWNSTSTDDSKIIAHPDDPARDIPVINIWNGPPNVSELKDAGVHLGSIFACTLEPMNKNPVTETVIEVDLSQMLDCRASFTWVRYHRPSPKGMPVNGKFPPSHTGEVAENSHRTSNFRSDHRGGANFCLADGSVVFLAETIDKETYRALSTIRGNEVLANGVTD